VTAKLAEELVADCHVRTIGDPANTEQDWPTIVTAAQFVFAEPGPSVAKLYIRLGWAANDRKSFSGTLAAVRGEAIPTPSPTASGPPVKVRFVPIATAAWKPGGTDVGSGPKVADVRVTVMLPSVPITRFPITLAEAAVTRNNAATTPRMIIEFEIRYIVLLRQVNSAHLLMFWY